MKPESVEFEHAGRAYRVTFAGANDGARCLGLGRKNGDGYKYLDMFSPIAREVIALARVKIIEKALGR